VPLLGTVPAGPFSGRCWLLSVTVPGCRHDQQGLCVKWGLLVWAGFLGCARIIASECCFAGLIPR